MSALVTISANDGTPVTPVTYTFTPAGRTKDGYWIFEQTTPAPVNALAAAQMHVRLVREKQTPNAGTRLGGAARVHGKLWIPVMETTATNDAGITPPPTVAYTLYAETLYVLPERSVRQNRVDLRNLASGLVGNNASILGMVHDLQDLW